jgi:hypothetical protein
VNKGDSAIRQTGISGNRFHVSQNGKLIGIFLDLDTAYRCAERITSKGYEIWASFPDGTRIMGQALPSYHPGI